MRAILLSLHLALGATAMAQGVPAEQVEAPSEQAAPPAEQAEAPAEQAEATPSELQPGAASDADAIEEATTDIQAALPGVTPGTPPPADDVQIIARDIGEGLRCPVCQGMSVADSTSPAAVAMLRKIESLVAAGYARRDIDAYFVSKYGEWVLLKPTTTGMNKVVWLGPFVAFLAGLALVWGLHRGGDEEEEEHELPPPDGTSSASRYTAQLLDEVDDD